MTKVEAPLDDLPGPGGGPGADPMPAVRPGYYRVGEYDMSGSVGYLMKQVVAMVSRVIEERMAKHGLTDAQWRPLFYLSNNTNSPNTATHIARAMYCDAGATTRMLDRLEDKGLLRRERSVDDRRVQQLALTEEGRRVAAIVPYVLCDVLNAHLADLSRAEVDQLRDLLQRILVTGRREAGADTSREA
jgi:DNA-binding MarR family transcriptional regulator